MDNCDSCTDSDTCDEAVGGYVVDTSDSNDARAGVQHSCISKSKLCCRQQFSLLDFNLPKFLLS